MNEEEESLIGKIERFLNKDNDVIVTDENIRELLNTIDKYLDLYNKEKEKNEKLERQMGKDLDIVYIKGIYDERDKWENKIKAKIEYYRKIDNTVGIRILENFLEDK